MHEERPRAGRPCAPDHRLTRAGLSCLASLAVHGFALSTLYGAGVLTAPSSRPRPWPVALEPLTPSQWQVNRGISGAVPPPLPTLPPRAPREEPRQVVELPPDIASDPMREQRAPPADARYLAVRDQTVERQTISSDADSVPPKLLRVPQQKRKARLGSGERGAHKVALPGRTGPKGGGGTDADAAAPPPPPPEERAEAAPAELARTRATADPGLPPVDSALPSDGEGGQRIDGRRISDMPLQEYATPEGGPNYDGLGLDEGTETRLHTRRFAPAAYWTDVRARIQDDWHRRALSLLQQYDPREDTYFYKPRTVRIAVTLDANGGVKDVHVVESSRLEFYDAIALAVVKDKQPYPPPPPDAIRSDGNARINMAFTWLPSTRQIR